MRLPTTSPTPAPTAPYARALRTLRAYRGLGQRELSVRSGFSWGAISKWEMGKCGITTPNREILARAMCVPPDVFEALASGPDPLLQAMAGWQPYVPPGTLYNYQTAARQIGCCVNTVRAAVRKGVVTPTREARCVWFSKSDLVKIRAWRRRKAVRFRSRLRAYRLRHLAAEKVAAAA